MYFLFLFRLLDLEPRCVDKRVRQRVLDNIRP